MTAKLAAALLAMGVLAVPAAQGARNTKGVSSVNNQIKIAGGR